MRTTRCTGRLAAGRFCRIRWRSPRSSGKRVPADRGDRDRQTERSPRASSRSTAPSLDHLIVDGGPSRHQSEWNAIGDLAVDIESGALGLVAVHDGARPFVTRHCVDALIEAAAAKGGSMPGLPLDGVIVDAGAVASSTMRAAPASPNAPGLSIPHHFSPPIAAPPRADSRGLDTAETVRRFTDTEVVSVAGDPRNIKVTFSSDFDTAENFAARWLDGRWSDLSVNRLDEFAIGWGPCRSRPYSPPRPDLDSPPSTGRVMSTGPSCSSMDCHPMP